MKCDILILFLGGVSKEDISSFYLSYCEQELHFLSLRIGFLKSGRPPYFRHFRIIFTVKNDAKMSKIWGSTGFQKSNSQ